MAKENTKTDVKDKNQSVKKKEPKEVPVKLSWFKPADVLKEVKRVRWPKFSELMSNTLKVLVFGFAFGLFFVLCNLVISRLLLLLGVGA